MAVKPGASNTGRIVSIILVRRCAHEAGDTGSPASMMLDLAVSIIVGKFSGLTRSGRVGGRIPCSAGTMQAIFSFFACHTALGLQKLQALPGDSGEIPYAPEQGKRCPK